MTTEATFVIHNDSPFAKRTMHDPLEITNSSGTVVEVHDLRAMQARIEALERRVAELEGNDGR